MGRTEIKGRQVSDDTLTGADLNDGLGVYDETDSYEINDIVFWNARNYKCTSPVTAGTSGDLSNAPDIAVSNWEEVEVNVTGLTEAGHRSLDQLVHNISETSYYEITRTGNQVTNETWWATSSKLKKIREVDYTYTGNLLSQSSTKQYDSSGSLLSTYTETYTRTGNVITSINGVLS